MLEQGPRIFHSALWASLCAQHHLGAAAATPAVLARLVELSQDANDNVRRHAAWALGQMMTERKPMQAAVLTSFCQAQLTSDKYEFIGGAFQSFGQFAFDTLHRLAAQRARLGPAKPAARAKAKAKRPRRR